MEIFGIFLVGIAVTLVAAVPDVALLAPSYIRPGKIVRLHAQVDIADSDIDLDVALTRDDENKTIISKGKEQLTSSSLAIFMDFEVPPKLPIGRYKLDVSIIYGNQTTQRSIALKYKSSAGFGVLIQTDKGIYKAGQTVMFRVMGADAKGRVVKMPMTIEIFDGGRNRIRRWADVEDSSGVFAGEMVMSEFPVLGTWTITATINNVADSKTFKVEEFVLPKFDVILDIPSIGSPNDNALVGNITAKYTFGKTVIGTAVLSVKQSSSSRKLEQKIKIEGETEFSILHSDLKRALSLSSLNNARLDVKIIVTEASTGISREDSAKIEYYEFNLRLDFEEERNYYFKPGFPLTATILVQQRNGRPIDEPIDSDITLRVTGYYRRSNGTQKTSWGTTRTKYSYENFDRGNFPIPKNGKIPLEFLTSSNLSQLYVRLELKKNVTRHIWTTGRTFNPFRSNSKTYMSLTALTENLLVGQTVQFKAKSNKEFSSLGMQVMSKGIAVKSEMLMVAKGAASTKTFSVKLTEAMAPKSVLIVWLYVARELVPAHLILNIKSTIGGHIKQVSVKFSESQVRPDESVNVIVKALPLSNAYLTVIDKSVLILSKGNDITPSVISGVLKQDEITAVTSTQITGDYRNAIQVRMLSGKETVQTIRETIPASTWHKKDTKMSLFMNSAFCTGSYVKVFGSYDLNVAASLQFFVVDIEPRPVTTTGPTTERTTETTTVFFPTTTVAEASFASTTNIFASTTGRVTTTTPFPTSAAHTIATTTTSNVESTSKPPSTTKRSVFPDTWLFTNFSIGEDGKGVISAEVPDTITSWVATAFVVTPSMFLQAASAPATVIVTLHKSWKYRSLKVLKRAKRTRVEEACGKVKHCIFVKSGRATPVFFPMIPKELGQIEIKITAESPGLKDTVIKKLRVEPEGIQKEFNVPVLVDLTNSSYFDEKIEFEFPPNVVEDSKRMKLSVVGDVMGPTVDGLENLVRMPYGCGEQNLISFAPSVFVTKYLEAVDRLSSDIKFKALNYMTIGVQRQLRYQHFDGSYSAFGNNDRSGTTWLTSYVLRVFSLALPYIGIQSTLITKPLLWITKQQNNDGSFREPGIVLHSAMQGQSVNSDRNLAAYVLIALLQGKAAAGSSLSNSSMQTVEKVVDRAVGFLETGLKTEEKVYSLAISCYALKLAGRKSADIALQKLEKKAIVSGGKKHWELGDAMKVSRFHYGLTARSADIEMTAYVLLAYALYNDLVNGAMVNKWLVSERNPRGGFISTQDTAIGLEGLAEINAGFKDSTTDMKIHVSWLDEKLHRQTFKVNEENSMVLQTVDVSVDAKSMTVHAVGTKGSTAVLQVSLFYNINIDLERQSFALNITVEKETVNGFTVKSCVRWLEKEKSAMTVMEIGVPSGFEANLWSIPSHPLLKRSEVGFRKVNLYLDEVTSKEVCISLGMTRDTLVADVKPVACRVYEYYEPSNQVTAFYTPLTLKRARICDICGIECGCDEDKSLTFPKSWCMERAKSDV